MLYVLPSPPAARSPLWEAAVADVLGLRAIGLTADLFVTGRKARPPASVEGARYVPEEELAEAVAETDADVIVAADRGIAELVRAIADELDLASACLVRARAKTLPDMPLLAVSSALWKATGAHRERTMALPPVVDHSVVPPARRRGRRRDADRRLRHPAHARRRRDARRP